MFTIFFNSYNWVVGFRVSDFYFCLYISTYIYTFPYTYVYLWASLVAQVVKNLPVVQETWVLSLGWEDLLGKGMATQSSVPAWRIPWTEKPGRLKSMGLQRVGHNWVNFTFFKCLFIVLHIYKNFKITIWNFVKTVKNLWSWNYNLMWEDDLKDNFGKEEQAIT